MNRDQRSPPSGGAGTDEVLLTGVLAGEETAFRALYHLHTPRLRQLVLRIVGEPRADAEDVVQETWIRAVKALPAFRREAAFGTWLTGIAIRTSWGLLRSRRRHPESALPDGLDPPGPAPRLGERVDLERAVAALPDRQRSVLLLHDLEGFTHEEIGALLEIAPGTSKADLFQARRTMRHLLDQPHEASRDTTA